ncbi:MAG TPA: M20/M25/M40 family metallo-hydrolase, partial [Acetobacteraceae bacterium]|nr:M20/M25/M40 family metallo-hydrolase [Acetobacteraceae bacterium]
MPAPQPETIDAVLRHVDAGLDSSRERLFALLRIPSISAQPDHRQDCVRAAEFLRDQLTGLGFTAGLRPTAGHPVVLAHHPGPDGYRGPHVLFYGHYDVQPVDPLELWTSPPFEPQLVDGPRGPRFVARGAVDDKGQTMMLIEALRAWKQVTGSIPARITALIEGEEEVGSRNLEPFLEANRDELRGDLALISDTGMWDIDTPALTTRLRGMAYTQVTLRAANRDLHSGLFGGSALNPINALCHALGELHDANGRIQIPGFYDGVQEPSNAQAAEWASLNFDEAGFLADIGLRIPVGERGRPALQRLWARPTADINGIWGGYTGPGSKTVIAADAFAKVSFRLVPGQDPQKVVDGFRRFLAERVPADARVEVESFTGSPGIELAADSPWLKAAQAALAEEFGKPAVMVGSGGS